MEFCLGRNPTAYLEGTRERHADGTHVSEEHFCCLLFSPDRILQFSKWKLSYPRTTQKRIAKSIMLKVFISLLSSPSPPLPLSPQLAHNSKNSLDLCSTFCIRNLQLQKSSTTEQTDFSLF